jgi:hypothetical protein
MTTGLAATGLIHSAPAASFKLLDTDEGAAGVFFF